MSKISVELRGVSKTFPERGDRQALAAVQDLELQIRAGEFFTLLGPSGCGKSTTLRMIARFESPTSGEIRIQDQPMNSVPAYRRPVNMVFQDYALFPHLTVAHNVEFGLKVKGVPKEQRDPAVKQALELVQLSGHGEHMPDELSGGQQQRVALARALINRPAVLLLDEPLGALDLKLRKAMQFELKQIQSQVGCTFVYVTHDQEEALKMSDRVAVMNQGRLLQVGDPSSIYEKPATRFVADFIGETNFLSARVLKASNGSVLVEAAGREMLAQWMNGHATVGEAVTLTVRPERITLSSANGGHRNGRLHGIAQDVTYLGTDTLYRVGLQSGEGLLVRVQNSSGVPRFSSGDSVELSWDPADAQALVE